MSKINEYCVEEKLAILKEHEAGQGSRSEIACKYNINVSTLKEWQRRYKLYGVEGLACRAENKSYSAELKLQAVQDYLSGKYSQNEIIRKYRMASRTQLRNWIKKYNSHSGLWSYANQSGYAKERSGFRITISYTLSYNLHEKPGYLKDIRVHQKSPKSLDTYRFLGILKVRGFQRMARITPYYANHFLPLQKCPNPLPRKASTAFPTSLLLLWLRIT